MRTEIAVLLGLMASGCAKEEPPAVPVAVATIPTASASPSLVATSPAPSSASAAASTPGLRPVYEPPVVPEADLPGLSSLLASLRVCCAALQASAASQPSPQNMSAMAAQYCLLRVRTVSSVEQKVHAMGVIRSALHGEPLPAACR